MSASETATFIASPRIVEIVAAACNDDQRARALAGREDAVLYEEADEHTRAFWRCVARAALEAGGHLQLCDAAQTVLDGLHERIDSAPKNCVPVFAGIADLASALAKARAAA